jgi:hypothetical protein
MNAISIGNDSASRVIEALAGTAMLSDPAATATAGPYYEIAGSGTSSGMSDATPTADHAADGILAPLTQLLDATPADAASATDAAGGTSTPLSGLESLTGLLGAVDGDGTSPLQLAGPDATLQPVFDTANAGALNLHVELENLGHEVGLGYLTHSVTDAGETVGLGVIGEPPGTTVGAAADGHTLLTDVLNLPGDLLSGNVNDVVSNLGSDLTETLQSVFSIKDSLIFGANDPTSFLYGTGDPTNPVPELLTSLGHDVQSLPILNVSNGDGGLLDGVIGNLTDSSSHHLVDVDAGPEQPDGLVFDLLSAPQSGDHHTAEINAIDVAPGGPTLANLDLLTGSGDGLLGGVLNPGSATAGTSQSSGLLSHALPLPDLSDGVGLLGGVTDHGILHGAHIL